MTKAITGDKELSELAKKLRKKTNSTSHLEVLENIDSTKKWISENVTEMNRYRILVSDIIINRGDEFHDKVIEEKTGIPKNYISWHRNGTRSLTDINILKLVKFFNSYQIK